jgi:hypothetical protein
MARRRGFLAELQYQLRMREQERRFLAHQQRLTAQAEREQQRALRAAEQASTKAAREEQARHVEHQRWYAAHLSQMVRDRVEELASLLADHASAGLMALAEVPHLCSLKFPTRERCRL